MLRNYFKTVLRNLSRDKVYTAITVSGLAIGIAACLLIFLVIRYELSYNKFLPYYSSIYHIATQDKTADGMETTPGVPYPTLDALRTDFPQLKTGAMYACFGTQVTVAGGGKIPDKKFIEEDGVYFVDQPWADMFSYRWLIGNPRVLEQPDILVLTRTYAEKYFGDWKNCIGKTLKLDNAFYVKVAGVIEDTPLNTDFPVKLLGSYITIKNNRYYGYTTDWGSITSNFRLFMLIPDHLKAGNVEKQLAQLADKYYDNKGVNKRSNVLQPMSKIHFDETLPGFADHTTSYTVLTTLGLIAFLIIVMACINFINLSTAQAITRSKEVGVRKVLGSNRIQLFTQVMSETLMIALSAALIALLLAKAALPYIKHIISIKEELDLLSLQNMLFIFATLLIVTLLSGIYPAFILSGFKPVTALKNKVNSASIGGISLRRALVVTQFAISQILIVGTIVAVSQMNFISTADLGFNKEAVLALYSSSDSAVRVRNMPFKQDLLAQPGVKFVSFCSDVPSSENTQGTNFAFDHKPDENFTLTLKFGDADYFKTFDLHFVAGEPYKADDTARQVVVNETLLKKLNVKNPQDVIGKDIRMGGGRWQKICGVVKDFTTNSLRDHVNPLMILAHKKRYSMVSVKLSSHNLQATRNAIQKSWDRFYPEYAFVSVFMDEKIEQFYVQEKQLALLYKIFAALAVFISCLGLYGLVSFMAVQKTKEVGIRKVLGAGVVNIVLLFSKEFTILIALAFLIAAPVAWYFMNQWLNNFAFRITIQWPVFFAAIAISLLVAWLAVGYKALRAAIAQPVKSLRTE